ncbi:MAG: VOC family protein [Tannerellaceae bacterium]|jgi:catechol 2,3-dioxygenase-like lactoylglutathione lyase family enzyme|nr:VOC family protein [Tannerellaceae bacterium]
MYRKIITALLMAQLIVATIRAAEPQRPPVWGIAKMTFLVSSMDMAREYYGRFLGFAEAFSYPSDLGTVVSFKVNDRQFLEFIEDKDAKEKTRLVSLSLETESVSEMHSYLISRGLSPTEPKPDGAGNEAFSVQDSWGNVIEFVDLNANGLHRQSRGKFLSETRISSRIHHAGLYSGKLDENDPFWAGIMQCREIVRYPLDKNEAGVIQYLGLPECTENIEHYSPCDRNFSHPCLLVDDMQDAIYTLKERRRDQRLARPSIGRTKRWLLNLLTPDGTRVEFTEAFCIK